MKNVLACCLVLSSAFAAAADARANEYVCELTLMPSAADPARGSFGYVSMYTSQQPGCAGQTAVYSICSKGAMSNACGVTAQYSEVALIGLYETLRSAEADQHPVVANWSACVGGPGSCTGSVSLYADF